MKSIIYYPGIMSNWNDCGMGSRALSDVTYASQRWLRIVTDDATAENSKSVKRFRQVLGKTKTTHPPFHMTIITLPPFLYPRKGVLAC